MRQLLFVVLLSALLWPAMAFAVEPGESPYIYGMHDEPDAGLFTRDGCARGWITVLRYIGSDGTCGAGDLDYTQWTDQGFGIIMRLDSGGAPSVPADPAQWDGYADAFADCVARSSGIKVWVVGNEPNLHWGHPEDRPFRPDEYGEIYKRTLAAVNALPNGEDHEVLFAAMGPWASLPPWGDWDDGMSAALDHAGSIDGVAIHAYTREFTPGAITSDAWFPGRENKWHLHFRLYRDVTRMLANKNLLDIPLYITEAGNACDPPCDPYPDSNVGYFNTMYDEIHQWNQDNPRQVIRAVTPYRWTTNDDGTGRDFCIGCSQALKDDLAGAVDDGHRWSTGACSNQCQVQCGGMECGDDGCGGACGSCAGSRICSNGACVTPDPDAEPDMGADLTSDITSDTSSDLSTDTAQDLVLTDASLPDSSSDATSPQMPDTERNIEGACGCAMRPNAEPPLAVVVLAFLLLALRTRRRASTG